MRKVPLAFLAALLSLSLSTDPPRARGASFQGLGLPPGGGETYVNAVSSDGSTVVGYVETGETSQAFRWTSGGGIEGLGALDERSDSRALALSDDGVFVYGVSGGPFDEFVLPGTAFRWNSTGGMQVLADLSSYFEDSTIADISSDGSTIIGEGVTPFDFVAFHATSGGSIELIGSLPGSFGATPVAVSDDGSVVVANSFVESGGAFRWTSAGGIQDLGTLPEAFISYATAISGDGSTIVGITENFETFRWTATGGMQGLGGMAYPYGVSSDGSEIVGGAPEGGAILWDAAHGMRSLQQVLVDDYGIDLTGWSLDIASAVSADGLTIVGDGTNPAGQHEAWIARLGGAPAPNGNFNGDAVVDGNDLAQWRGDFANNDDSDADGDGDSDGADFLVWQQQVGGASAAPAGGAVPEPGGLALVCIGGVLLRRRRGRGVGSRFL